jgi:hypothetical protein
MKPTLQKSTGYLCMYLPTDGKPRRSVRVHRLVLETFMAPPPPGKYQAAHWDLTRTDNRLVGLRWATPVENAADRKRQGTIKYGEANPAWRTHCPQGHEYTTDNVLLGRNVKGAQTRRCKTCMRERERERRVRDGDKIRAYQRGRYDPNKAREVRTRYKLKDPQRVKVLKHAAYLRQKDRRAA